MVNAPTLEHFRTFPSSYADNCCSAKTSSSFSASFLFDNFAFMFSHCIFVDILCDKEYSAIALDMYFPAFLPHKAPWVRQRRSATDQQQENDNNGQLTRIHSHQFVFILTLKKICISKTKKEIKSKTCNQNQKQAKSKIL